MGARGDEIVTVDPATEEETGRYPFMTGAEVEATLGAVARAFRGWRELPVERRGELMHAAAQILRGRIPELAALITREMGKPTREAKGEIMLVASIYGY